MYCYFGGKIMLVKNATLDINDIGVLRGYGVFDYLRTYNGKPFLLDEHLKRFWRSARHLNMRVPTTQVKLASVIHTLLDKNGLREAAVRILLTGGKAVDGMNYNGSPTFLVLVEPLHLPLRSWYERGIALMTYEHERHMPEAKTTNYITAIALQKQKKKRGAVEILYTSRGLALEGTTSNFFVVKKGRIATPHCGILHGTTRNFVINLARAHFSVEERDVRLRELRVADEAFITATNKEILPVVRVDRIRIGTGRVGPHTRRLMFLFQQRVKTI